MYETAISLFAIGAVETFGWAIDMNLKFFEEECSSLGSSVLTLVWECLTFNIKWKTRRKENQEQKCWDGLNWIASRVDL